MMRLMLQRRGVNCCAEELYRIVHAANKPMQTSICKLACNGISNYSSFVNVTRRGVILDSCFTMPIRQRCNACKKSDFINSALQNSVNASSTSTSYTTASSKAHHKSNTVSSNTTAGSNKNSSASNTVANRTHANKVTRYSKLGMDGFTDVKFNAAADAML